MKILNCIVCYNNEDEILKYMNGINRLLCENDIDYTMTVTINSMKKYSLYDFKRKISNNCRFDVSVFTSENNLGYLNGMLYGYNMIKKNNNTYYDWVLFCNTDIIFKQVELFHILSKTVYEKDVWCIAPSVFAAKTKTYSNPHYFKRITSTKIKRNIRIFSNTFCGILYIKLAEFLCKRNKRKREKSCYVYSPHGCFFFLKTELIEKLNTNYYSPIMYSEESHIAEIIRNCEKKVYYDSVLEVIHDESSVTGKLASKQKIQYIKESLDFINRTYYE